MYMKFAVIAAGVVIGAALPIGTAAADSAFGPGRWALTEVGTTGVAANWRAVADCGENCLTVTEGDASAQFSQQSNGAWTGNWRIVDGDCYDESGNRLPATATWTSNFTVNPDLTVADHVVDEIGCDGVPGAYDVTYSLSKLPGAHTGGGDHVGP
jgi:hypothetical protein